MSNRRRIQPTLPPLHWLARVLLSALLCLGMAAPSLRAQAVTGEEAALEHQVKAAMLYKFLSYVDWPASAFPTADSPYKIWVIGAARVEQELRDIVEARQINGRPVRVYKKVKSIGRIPNPHVVFVGRHGERYLPQLTELAERHSFLLITESDLGPPNGSAINLRLVGDRVGFDVSLSATQRYGLRLSSRLLSIASSVEGTAR